LSFHEIQKPLADTEPLAIGGDEQLFKLVCFKSYEPDNLLGFYCDMDRPSIGDFLGEALAQFVSD